MEMKVHEAFAVLAQDAGAAEQSVIDNNAYALYLLSTIQRDLRLSMQFPNQQQATIKKVNELLMDLQDRLVDLGEDATQHMVGLVRMAKVWARDTEQPEKENHPLSADWVRNHVWDLTGGHCTYCGCALDRKMNEDGSNRNIVFCVEHVVPRSAGGPDHIKNYVPSCAACNTSKRDRHVLTFIHKTTGGKIRRVA